MDFSNIFSSFHFISFAILPINCFTLFAQFSLSIDFSIVAMLAKLLFFFHFYFLILPFVFRKFFIFELSFLTQLYVLAIILQWYNLLLINLYQIKHLYLNDFKMDLPTLSCNNHFEILTKLSSMVLYQKNLNFSFIIIIVL